MSDSVQYTVKMGEDDKHAFNWTSCAERRCAVPLASDAKVPGKLRIAHRLSRLDPESTFWKAVRKGATKMTKAQTAWTNDIEVRPRYPDIRETRQSPLEELLQEQMESCLINTRPDQQDRRFFLLHGPPGTSKTHSTKATARRMGLSLMQVMPSQIHRKVVGETSKVLKAIFLKASLHQPCMLFFDGFEELGRSRDRHCEYGAALTGELLQYLNGMDGQQGIIVMGCTDMPTSLDSAILGLAGDRAIEVTVPDTAMRRVVWQNQLKSEDIEVTQEQLEQLCAKQLRWNLRGIGDAIDAFGYEEDDVAKLIEEAHRLVEHDEEDDTDALNWMRFTQRVCDVSLASDAKVHTKLHMAHRLDPESKFWRDVPKGTTKMTTAQAVLTELKDGMRLPTTTPDAMLNGQKHPRSNVEPLQRVQSKKLCVRHDASVGIAEVAAAMEETKAVDIEDNDEEKQNAPTCSKRSCYRATTQARSGRWLRQCASCRAMRGTKKKPPILPETK
jgi:SpoVK/Ycf46/Vps4 family AAA+-type ATPase